MSGREWIAPCSISPILTARFAVYKLRSGIIALDCQADLLSHVKTRFVVPLLPIGEVPPSLGRLHPVFEVAGQNLAMATHLASTVPASEIGERITSLEAHDLPISNALDMLMTGF
jgi:toxin CcdB